MTSIVLPSVAEGVVTSDMRQALRLLDETSRHVDRLERSHALALGELTYAECRGEEISETAKKQLVGQLDHIKQARAKLATSVAALQDLLREAPVLISPEQILKAPPVSGEKKTSATSFGGRCKPAMERQSARDPIASEDTEARRAVHLPLFEASYAAQLGSLRICTRNGMTVVGKPLSDGRFAVLPGSLYRAEPLPSANASIRKDRREIEARNILVEAGPGVKKFTQTHVFRGPGQALHAIYATPCKLSDFRDTTLEAAVIGFGLDRSALLAALREIDPPQSAQREAGAETISDETYRIIRNGILDEALEVVAPAGTKDGPGRYANFDKRVLYSKSVRGRFQVRKEGLHWVIGPDIFSGLCLFVFGIEGYVVVSATEMKHLIGDDWMVRQTRGNDAYRFVMSERTERGEIILHLGEEGARRIGPYPIQRT